MGIGHVTVTFDHVSGLARDSVVNTFTFEVPGDFWSAPDHTNALIALDTFYNAINGSATQKIATYLSPALSRSTGATVRSYDVTNDLGGTPVGSPLAVGNLSPLGAPLSANALPSEVACCLSFRQTYDVDVEFAPGARPRARDRGRVFIGPLVQGAVAMATPARARPADALQEALVESGRILMQNTDVNWVVWSRKLARVRPVLQVWADDAFDTVRRRGERPTAKTIRNA
jgi:hypothetical protein